jgi:hypothetical protein
VFYVKVEYDTDLGKLNQFTENDLHWEKPDFFHLGSLGSTRTRIGEDKPKFTIISAYDADYIENKGFVAWRDDPNVPYNTDHIKSNFLEIINNTSKKLVIKSVKNSMGTAEKISIAQGVLGCGYNSVFAGEEIDPKGGKISKKIDTLRFDTNIVSQHSFDFCFPSEDTNKNYSIGFNFAEKPGITSADNGHYAFSSDFSPGGLEGSLGTLTISINER